MYYSYVAYSLFIPKWVLFTAYAAHSNGIYAFRVALGEAQILKKITYFT